MSAAAGMQTAALEPMALVRALRRMQSAGFTVSLEDGKLLVDSSAQLTTTQRDYLRSHKGELVRLLTDAERLATLLEQAGSAGLGWKEGTPPEWDDGYLLAVGEILYGTHRMVNRLGRRYATAVAPPLPDATNAVNVAEIESFAEEMA